MRQTLTITGWHPTSTPNAQNHHWRSRQKRHHVDRDMAWASARQAGWDFMPGRVKLTVTFVYPRTVRVDADNLVARCKGLIDGLKDGRAPGYQKSRGTQFIAGFGNVQGYFTDDSTVYLDLHVNARIEKGVKATEITLESTE